MMMAMSDNNKKFQKMLSENNIDGILEFCKSKLTIDPLDATIFVWGYSYKDYDLIRDRIV